MQEVLRSRRGLVVSAAIVILCIIGFFLATASNWRPFINNAAQPLASIPAQTTPPPANTAAQDTSAAGKGPAVPANPGAAPPQNTTQAAVGAGPSTPKVVPAPSAPPPPPASAPLRAPSAPPPGPANPQTAAAPPVVPGTASSSSSQAGAAKPATPPIASSSESGSPSVQASGQTAPAQLPLAPVPSGRPLADAASTAPPPASAPAPVPPPAGATATADATVPASPAGHAAAGAARSTDSLRPSFDILRVEPKGDSVIAARGVPNADIDLLDNGAAIAHATADASGQVAFLPPALKPGEHSLALSMKTPDGKQIVSSQSVAVSIPAQPRTAPMVALIQPNQPAAILSGPVAGSDTGMPPVGMPSNGKVVPTGPVKPAVPDPVTIGSVEVESMGNFYATGHAPPGSKSRIYLNDAYVATVTAGPTGNWSLRINRGMKSGRYQVRADQVLPDGKVAARAQVPFDYPGQVASAAASMDAAKKKSEAPNASPATSSPAGDGGSAANGPAGTNNPSSADARGAAPAGAADAAVGGSGASSSRSTSGQDGGAASAGSAVVALGGADGGRPQAKAGVVAGTPGVPAGSGESLPPVTSSPTGATSVGVPPSHPGASPSTGPQSQGSTAGGADAPSKDRNGANGTAAIGADHAPATAGASGKPSVGAEATPSAKTADLADANGAGGAPANSPAASMPLGGQAGAAAGSPAEPTPPSQAVATSSQNRSTAADNAGAAATTGQPAAPHAGSGSPSPATAEPPAGSDEGPTVVEELVTAKVVYGDSLWRISRHMLGHGTRYTQIYAANTQEIRDPRLIYPGQVFVLPQE